MGFLTKLKNKLLGKRENSDQNKVAASKIDLKKHADIKAEVDKAEADTIDKRTTLEDLRDHYFGKYNVFDDIRLRSSYSVNDFVPKEDKVAFKAVRDGIAVLKIPAEARVICGGNATTITDGLYKMRAQKAEVLAVYASPDSWLDFDGIDKPAHIHRHKFKLYRTDMSYSLYDERFKYVAGETVEPDYFDTSPITCGHGIHFFATPEEAMLWYLRI